SSCGISTSQSHRSAHYPSSPSLKPWNRRLRVPAVVDRGQVQATSRWDVGVRFRTREIRVIEVAVAAWGTWAQPVGLLVLEQLTASLVEHEVSKGWRSGHLGAR